MIEDSNTTSHSAAKNKRRALTNYLARFFVLLLVIVLSVVALEGALRAGGYGRPGRFLKVQDISGARMLVYNPDFAQRFFPEHWPVKPYPFAFAPEKPQNTRRVFVLGESAAQGFPDPAFSFSRMLQVMLEAHYPGRRFEVINTAMPLLSTHVMRVIARECAQYQPDLFVIYAGNTEVTGPYGPATDPGGRYDRLWKIRLTIALQATRSGQLLYRLFAAHEDAPAWGDMQPWIDHPIRAGDRRLARAREMFERNIQAIYRTAERAGAGVILCAPPIRLKDFSPLGAMHRPGFSEEDRIQWQALVDEADILRERGEWANALGRYTRAAVMDDTHAALQFRIGQCHWALAAYDAAHAAYLRAAALDTLRFQINTDTNQQIRQITTKKRFAALAVVDAEKAFAAESPQGIAGDNLFYDHCHLNIEGNYLLASLVFAQTHTLLGGAPLTAGAPDAPPVHEQECMERLGMTPLQAREHLRLILGSCEKPPFTDRFDHAAWKTRCQERIDAMASQVESERLRQYAVWFRGMLPRARPDPMLHRNYAQLLEALGSLRDAAAQWGLAAALLPHSGEIWLGYGRALLAAGDADAAVTAFQHAVGLMPMDSEVHHAYATALQQAGATADAIAVYRRYVALHPQKGEAYQVMGAALETMGEVEDAAQAYREGIAMDPGRIELYYRLGGLLRQQGDAEAAIAVLRQGLEKQPGHYPMHAMLAEILERTGDRKGLAACYETMATLRPDDAALWFRFGVVQESLDEFDAAIASFQRVLELDPERVDAQGRIALLFWRKGDAESALKAASQCEAMGGTAPPGLVDEITRARER